MEDFCFFLNLKKHGFDFGFNFPVCYKVEELIFKSIQVDGKAHCFNMSNFFSKTNYKFPTFLSNVDLIVYESQRRLSLEIQECASLWRKFREK